MRISADLAFAITGVQKHSEAAILRVRVDGVVRLHPIATALVIAINTAIET